MVMRKNFRKVPQAVERVRRDRPQYRNGNDIPSLQPDSAERMWRIRLGRRVLNWEFERTEAARTGLRRCEKEGEYMGGRGQKKRNTYSVGVRQADITRDVTKSVFKRQDNKKAQISQENVITGPRRISRDWTCFPISAR
jgi:hypothetical protein